jgi:predicted PurR-regulated permease PerM
MVMIFALVFIAFALFIRISQIDHQIQEDAGTLTATKIAMEKKAEQLDAAIQVEVKERMKEIDEVIEMMNKITEDIGRLDAQTSQDHRDLVDIRSRYILYREPAQEEPTDGND